MLHIASIGVSRLRCQVYRTVSRFLNCTSYISYKTPQHHIHASSSERIWYEINIQK